MHENLQNISMTKENGVCNDNRITRFQFSTSHFFHIERTSFSRWRSTKQRTQVGKVVHEAEAFVPEDCMVLVDVSQGTPYHIKRLKNVEALCCARGRWESRGVFV